MACGGAQARWCRVSRGRGVRRPRGRAVLAAGERGGEGLGEAAVKLSDFRVLSFDCYGTLIDWESGIWQALEPLRARVEVTREAALEAFARLESRQQAQTPGMPYPEVLAAVHGQLAAAWGAAADAAEDAAFAASIGDWPAFPDTAEALEYLKQHFRLVVLSNVDRAGFAATKPWLGVAFDAVYTAQDIGTFKPDPRNFRYLLDRLGELGFRRDRRCCMWPRACSTTTSPPMPSVLPRPGSIGGVGRGCDGAGRRGCAVGFPVRQFGGVGGGASGRGVTKRALVCEPRSLDATVSRGTLSPG